MVVQSDAKEVAQAWFQSKGTSCTGSQHVNHRAQQIHWLSPWF